VLCALHNYQREEMAATMLIAYPLGFVTLLVWTGLFVQLLELKQQL